MDKQQLIYLLKAYQQQTATPQERETFAKLLHDPQYEALLAEIIDQNWSDLTSEELAQLEIPGAGRLLEEIKWHPHPAQNGKRWWPRLAMAAAAVVAVVSISLYFYPDTQVPAGQAFTATTDIDPGKEGATLTLANGKKIRIADALAGNIADESGVTITKTKDGMISYVIAASDGAADGSTSLTSYNTLSTTRGEQIQVRLQDGTLVYLNARSALRYPTRFVKGGKRTVELSGEGYFEVAKDKQHPFVVNLTAESGTEKGQSIQVLGTVFNVSNYSDDAAVKTTLLEGSVQVNDQQANTYVVLKPGQQAISSQGTLSAKAIEVEDEVAWKNGSFMFNNETLESILKKVERWYDVEAVYTDQSLKQKRFFATVSRFDKVSELLKLLQETQGAAFEIKGRQIIVSPKK